MSRIRHFTGRVSRTLHVAKNPPRMRTPIATRLLGKLMHAESRELALTGLHSAMLLFSFFLFFFCFHGRRNTWQARVIGTRIYSRVRALAITRAFFFHFSRRARARDRSLFTSLGDLWKLDRDPHPSSIHRKTVGETRNGVCQP